MRAIMRIVRGELVGDEPLLAGTDYNFALCDADHVAVWTPGEEKPACPEPEPTPPMNRHERRKAKAGRK